MTSSHKETQKSMKNPDKFQAQLMRLFDWILAQWKILVGILVPVAVAVAGFFGWQVYQDYGKEQRVEKLGEIQMAYQEAQSDADRKVQPLESQLADVKKKIADFDQQAKADDSAADGNNTDGSNKSDLLEQKKKLESQIEEAELDPGEALKKFRGFYENNKKTPEGWTAGMTAARILIDQEEWEQARGLLESVLAEAQNVPFYRVQGNLVLVNLLQEMGKHDDALQRLDTLENQVDESLKPRILLARGQTLMLKNQNKEARKTLSKIIQEHGDSREARKARSMRILLN